MKCFQIKVFGFVQGVFFRHSAKIEAEKSGLTGYVKNLDDDSVEIVVCLSLGDGDENEIKEFIKWCEHGPALARVEKVETKETAPQKFPDFRII